MATGVVTEATDPAGGLTSTANSLSAPATAPVHYVATAYSLCGRTASGKRVSRGLIAADPSVLPLGTRVRLDAGSYSGEYLVADTGGAVRGKRIDIWTSSSREAMRFGRRTVKLTVLSYGPKRSARRLHRR
jgi:3D (Asp-Asp-Asp) domain-containing protein